MGIGSCWRRCDEIVGQPLKNNKCQDQEDTGQLVIDIGQVGDGMTDKVAITGVAKQSIAQGIFDVERLSGAMLKDFRVWRGNNLMTVIKFLVEKDNEAAFR